MKLIFALLILVLSLLIAVSDAFAPSSVRLTPLYGRSTLVTTILDLSSSSIRRTALSSTTPPNAEVEALLAAAAKARGEANKLAEELGRTAPTAAAAGAVAAATTAPKKSLEELKVLVPTIVAERNLEQQAASWQELKDSRSVTAFGSAQLKTFPVSLRMLQDRTGLTAETLGLATTDVDLDDFKYATLYVTGGATIAGVASLALLPPNVGATVCYAMALIPIAFIAVGSTAPAAIADAIAVVKGSNDPNRGGISTTERRIRHEAAHFCCGYWCGLPVSQYSIGDQNGVASVEFDVGTSSQYSNTEVAALAVTALAGLVGEASKYNTAVGAAQDLVVLDGVLRRSREFIGAAAQQDLTRWGALTAALLLKQNAAKYEQVVTAFGRQAGIDECVAILES